MTRDSTSNRQVSRNSFGQFRLLLLIGIAAAISGCATASKDDPAESARKNAYDRLVYPEQHNLRLMDVGDKDSVHGSIGVLVPRESGTTK